MRLLFFIIWVLLPIIALSNDDNNNCITCHLEIEDDDGPAHKISKDIHIHKGLSCVDCHGGDESLDDMDDVRKVRSYRGAPERSEVPKFCGSCHSDAAYMHEHNPALPTDQLSKYKTSVHGKKLFGENDQKVAVCTSCHTVHEIGDGKLPHSSTHPLNLPSTCGNCHSNKEYMAEYGIPTDQLEKYEKSIHGQALLVEKDLGAPACNDCHGNHGAAPPGVQSLAAVCGNCHALEAELFSASPHEKAYMENDFPMCETCHSNHYIVKPSDEFVGRSDAAKCVECHEPDDGTRGLQVADSIHTALINLVTIQGEADSMLQEARLKGMFTTDDELRMKDVHQALIQARTQVHSFDAGKVIPKAEVGMAIADSVKVSAASLVEEYYFRRKGLSLATVFLTLLSIGLYIKIKRLK